LRNKVKADLGSGSWELGAGSWELGSGMVRRCEDVQARLGRAACFTRRRLAGPGLVVSV